MEENNNYTPKEKAEGVWKGKEIKFTRVWNNHRFTDEEVEALLAGKEIEIRGLVSKNGNKYGIKGKLANQKMNGYSFVGFKKTDFLPSEEIPNSWCGHVFSEVEKTTLLAGNSVEIKGAKSSKGKTFDCWVTFSKDENGVRRIIADFDKS